MMILHPETKVSKAPFKGGGECKNDFSLFRTKKEKTEKSVRYKNFLCGQRIFSEILARARQIARENPQKTVFFITKSYPPPFFFF